MAVINEQFPAPGASNSKPSSSSERPPVASSSLSAIAKEPFMSNSKRKKLEGYRNSQPYEVRVSKTLSYLLRHGAQKESLNIRRDGYVRVDELLARPKLANQALTVSSLLAIVKSNDKQRFHLLEEEDPNTGRTILWIRANQGHSVDVGELELKRVKDPAEIPVVIHGTFTKNWEIIREEGLKAMKRTHIHCATGLYGEEGVISGMRANCDIFIEVDAERAMQDGIDFDISTNGVVLTQGRNGTLSPDYFKQVKNKQGEILYP